MSAHVERDKNAQQQHYCGCGKLLLQGEVVRVELRCPSCMRVVLIEAGK